MAFFIADESPIVAWLSGGFFGLCGLVALVTLHPASTYLTLHVDGFEVVSMFRKTFYRWKDVESFVPLTMHSNKVVAWSFSPNYVGNAKIRRLNHAISGIEAMLPDTFGMKHVELASLMNRLRLDHSEKVSVPFRST